MVRNSADMIRESVELERMEQTPAIKARINRLEFEAECWDSND